MATGNSRHPERMPELPAPPVGQVLLDDGAGLPVAVDDPVIWGGVAGVVCRTLAVPKNGSAALLMCPSMD